MCRGVSRRRVLEGGVTLAAAGLGAVRPAQAQQGVATRTNRLQPIPMPPQAPSREALAELAGTRLWYLDTGGSGVPIVLLHPASGSALIWGYQQPEFVKAGYRVIAYSRRGHYGSDPVEKDKPGIASEDLHALMSQFGIGKFHLVASAAGGSVAADYALSHQDRLLSLTVSSNSLGVRDGEIFRAATAIRPPGWDDMPVDFRELGPSYRAANPAGAKLWLELEHKSLSGNRAGPRPANEITDARLKDIKVPTLLISGAADLATPPSIHRMIAAHLPTSEMVVVEEAGHSVYWERPDQFNQAVLGFVAKHRP
jgi:pimeloyl-ACP methyl ester carboxylesterase